MTSAAPQFYRHPREYLSLVYSYPVISRRSKGLSIGLNLNPDKVCNWDCPYCQVDRTTPATVPAVDEAKLLQELEMLLADAKSGALWQHERFASTPAHLRRIQDIAFAGDGEPTSYKGFAGVIEGTLALKARLGLDEVPVNVLTNASLFQLPHVQAGLQLLMDTPSNVWCKLDAGTQEYYEQVNRSRFSLEHCLNNTLWLAQQRGVTIQSMLMRFDGTPPSIAELEAYTRRLQWLLSEGGTLDLVQVYTVARQPSEARCQPLTTDEVDEIVERVKKALPETKVEGYYGAVI